MILALKGPAGNLILFWSVAYLWFLAVVPGVFALQKNVFRQLPLYRFLEGQAMEDLQRQDQETYEKAGAEQYAISWKRWCVKKRKMRE